MSRANLILRVGQKPLEADGMSLSRDHNANVQSARRLCAFVNIVRAASVLLLLLAALRVPSLAAQGLDPSALLKPDATDTWPTYNGDYSGKRYSTLDQINAGNVISLPSRGFIVHTGRRSRRRRSK